MDDAAGTDWLAPGVDLTKREAVDLALRELVGHALTTEEALDLEGSGWEGDLEMLRAMRPAL